MCQHETEAEEEERGGRDIVFVVYFVSNCFASLFVCLLLCLFCILFCSLFVLFLYLPALD